MRITEIITEGVNDQFLYHGVPDGRTVMNILKSGEIHVQEPFDFDREQEDDDEDGAPPPKRISLTRDQYLHFPYGNGVAQFVIDKNALRRAGYKVKPVVGAMMEPKAETEEQVFKNIPVRAPFVVEIQYDPDLKIPNSVLDNAKSAGVKVTPWRKTGQHPAVPVPQPSGPGPATKYTDPERLVIQGEDEYWSGKPQVYHPPTQWGIWYVNADKSSRMIYPYIHYKDPKQLEPILRKLRARIAQGLSFDDLLPQSQYSKTWQQGKREIYPTDPGYKT